MSRFPWAIVLPALAFLVSGVVGGFQIVRWKKLEGERTTLRAEIRQLEGLLTSMPDMDEDLPIPALPESDTEQAEFLSELRQAASNAGIDLIKWDFVVRKSSGSKNTAPTVDDLKPIDCTLEVAGTYGALRAFLYDLAKSDRFYSYGRLTWRRDRNSYPRTHLTFTLTRYVTTAAPSLANNQDRIEGAG